jgi:ATP-dependent exoDNAse (exonuclease V) alpha subunit
MALETLDARLGRVMYHKPSKFSPAGDKYLIARTSTGETVKGFMQEPIEGEEYRFYGERKAQNGGYEAAFEFSTFEVVIDRSDEGLAQYLVRYVKGVGLAKARTIVEHFGGDTLAILEADPARVHEAAASGGVRITAADVTAITEHFNDPRRVDPVAYAGLIELFQGHRIPRAVIEDLARTWKGSAVSVVKGKPYSILLDYPRMGWKTVDALATTNLSYAKDGIDRQQAAILEALTVISNEGYTYATDVDAEAEAFRLIQMRPSDEAWAAVIDEEKVVARDGPQGEEVALKSLALAEETIARQIARLSAGCGPVESSLFTVEELVASGLNEDQRTAVEMVENHGVCLLTGAPGTGKSYTVAKIIKAIRDQGSIGIIVVAPTGKAAKRAEELIGGAVGPNHGIPCSTIHRALSPTPSEAESGTPAASAKFGRGRDEFGFSKNEANPIDATWIFIDECFPAGTMVDTPGGPRDIFDIRPGDPILNAWGIDQVFAISRKEVDRAVRLQIRETEIVVSERHPFFTRGGLVNARDLRPGDSILETASAVRLLRETIDHRNRATPTLLRSVLLNEMVDEFPRIQEAMPHRRAEPQMRRSQEQMASIRRSQGDRANRENRSTQAYVKIGNTNEMLCYSEVDGTPSLDPGRQWARADEGGSRIGRNSSGLDDLVCCPNSNGSGLHLSSSLQTGPSQSRTDDLHRTRRQLSSRDDSEGAGRSQDGIPHFARVDCAEVLESGDPRLDRFRDASGKLYFYDIQASRHQSFSISGLLVHNCSMVDVRLGASLLKAVAIGTRVIFIGDENQLPSVGPGSMLRDLVAAGLPRVTLDKIVRSDGGGRVVRACHAIKDGRRPEAASRITLPTENWVHIEQDDPAEIAREIVELHRATKTFPDPVWDIQCISPQRATQMGCDALNRMLADRLNPQPGDGNEADAERPQFRIGDKVVRLQNGRVDELHETGSAVARDAADDDLKSFTWQGSRYLVKPTTVVNGDMGIVADIVPHSKGAWAIVRFRWPDRLCRISMGDSHLAQAYALTVHKSQGSGFPLVIVPVHGSFYFDDRKGTGLWSRELCYTAISRAEKLLITVGQFAAIETAIRRKTVHRRRTRLVERLMEAMPVLAESKGVPW